MDRDILSRDKLDRDISSRDKLDRDIFSIKIPKKYIKKSQLQFI